MKTIIYDDKCSICQTSLGWAKRIDWLHRFDFLGYSEAYTLYTDLGDINDGVRLVLEDGTILVGYKAVRKILMQTPLGFIPALFTYLPGIYHLADAAYRYVASRRSTSCKIPHTHRAS